MKLLQWNIWYQEDIRNILKILKQIDADIICIQELTMGDPEHNTGIDTFQFLKENLSMEGFFKPSHEDPLNTFGNAIFSRYPIRLAQAKNIKDAEEEIKNFSQQARVYIEAEIDTPNAILSVGTTHTSYTDRFMETKEKEVETDELLNILKTKSSKLFFYR